MADKSRIEMLKLIGGGLIVATAFILMTPGWIDYISRIGRVLIMVFIALAIALTVVLGRHKLFGAKKTAADSAQPTETET